MTTCLELTVLDQTPLPRPAAFKALAHCVGVTALLLARGRVHLPPGHVGMRLQFADGATARVYRETVVDRPPPRDPCVLVVAFRLRAVHGSGHALFRAESLLNTPLFVGFPGYVSKLWLTHDEHEVYRGLYEWDGSRLAAAYARALWRVLALVCVPGSVHYMVLPGLHRDDILREPQLLESSSSSDANAWWRLVAASRRGAQELTDRSERRRPKAK